MLNGLGPFCRFVMLKLEDALLAYIFAFVDDNTIEQLSQLEELPALS